MQSLGQWRISDLMRGTVVILQTCFLVGCSTALQKKLGAADNAPDATTSAVRNADFSARSPTAADQVPDRQAPGPSGPLLFPGSEHESAPSRSRDSEYRVRTASLEPVTIRGDDVELNFEGAEIASAAKAVLGDVLYLNFAVDPTVQGTVTLPSVGPIARRDLLPTFESVLRMQNAPIVHDGKSIKTVPVSMGAGVPGFGISVVPLKYVSAATVAKTTENMLVRQGAIRVYSARNLLLIQGTTSERALDLISSDVEWLRNQSVLPAQIDLTRDDDRRAPSPRLWRSASHSDLDRLGHDPLQFELVNTIEMRNAGLIIKLLPHVNSNGTIELEVDQEVSVVANPNQPTLTSTIRERVVHSTVSVTSG
jgi:general secretion pathway protein D